MDNKRLDDAQLKEELYNEYMAFYASHNVVRKTCYQGDDGQMVTVYLVKRDRAPKLIDEVLDRVYGGQTIQ